MGRQGCKTESGSWSCNITILFYSITTHVYTEHMCICAQSYWPSASENWVKCGALAHTDIVLCVHSHTLDRHLLGSNKPKFSSFFCCWKYPI